ncbi:MAG: hypothetical protein IPJ81_19080 [Chitinophagaceae bacterium]|nr:hypothetical protein [Chitinophagaceae bacterium]
MNTEIINKAYLAGLKLKNSGLSEEVLYARLEKQGFPEELSRKVAKDIINENQKEALKNNLTYGLVVAAIGFVAAIISALISTDRGIISIELIIVGLGLAFWAIAKLKK